MAKRNQSQQSTPAEQKEIEPIKEAPQEVPDDELPESGEAHEGIFDNKAAPRGAFAKNSEPNRGILEAIKRAGSQRALAEALNVSQPTIMKWLWENCPAERAVEVEKETGVSRAIIRPDLFGEPELVYSKPTRTTQAINERYKKIEE